MPVEVAAARKLSFRSNVIHLRSDVTRSIGQNTALSVRQNPSSIAALFLLLVACGGSSLTASRVVEDPSAPPPRRQDNATTLSVSAAHEIAARVDQRNPRACNVHCDGSKNAVRLRFEDERDYRLVLIAKSVGARDELHVSNINRDTTMMLVENAEVGEMLSIHGEDAIKVCSKSSMALTECKWSCTFDGHTNVVQMATENQSAQFAVVCY